MYVYIGVQLHLTGLRAESGEDAQSGWSREIKALHSPLSSVYHQLQRKPGVKYLNKESMGRLVDFARNKAAHTWTNLCS